MPPPQHRITDLRADGGKLGFTARIGDAERRVWLKTASDLTPTADAVLAIALMPAMRFGGRLSLPDPVSPRLLRTQREFQAIQRAWSLEWDFGTPPLEEVEVAAPTREPVQTQGGRIGAFFSGGTDSCSTILDNPDITDLIFVRGFDLLLDLPDHVRLADSVEERLREAANDFGLPLHIVETNLRSLTDPLIAWDACYGSVLCAVALFLAPMFDRILIAGDSDYEVQVPLGANRLVDQLWSTEQLEIVDDGGRYSRIERLKRIAGHPVVQRTLRVCWENPGGAYNCGSCRKCLMTMISLEALGMREGVATFPAELDLDAITSIEITHPVLLTLWEDVLDTVRLAGRADLEPSVEGAVLAGKRRLGLPPDYRRRSRPAPPRLTGPEATAPDFDDTEATLQRLLQSRSWRLTSPLRRVGRAIRGIGRR